LSSSARQLKKPGYGDGDTVGYGDGDTVGYGDGDTVGDTVNTLPNPQIDSQRRRPGQDRRAISRSSNERRGPATLINKSLPKSESCAINIPMVRIALRRVNGEREVEGRRMDNPGGESGGRKIFLFFRS
jgi:hypothetical protein